jgi:site-specific DNA recombinase
MTDNGRKHAIGYVRVSTRNQADNGISLENQKERIKKYCEFYNLELIEILEDHKSGKSLKGRTAALDIIKRIEGKEFDCLVIYKLDRLGRSVIDLVGLTELMSKYGVDLHSLEEKIDTSTALGRFFFVTLASLAQLERDLISERTKSALSTKRANGGKGCYNAPYGKMAQGDRWIDDPQEQKAIRIVKEMKAQGIKPRFIAEHLNINGFRSRQGKNYTSLLVRKMSKADPTPDTHRV